MSHYFLDTQYNEKDTDKERFRDCDINIRMKKESHRNTKDEGQKRGSLIINIYYIYIHNN